MKDIPIQFPITAFENSNSSIGDTLTKQRVRIFYKGLNRNGSYISDEFADKLVQTLPYTPVKGIYDEENGDYTTHGTSRAEGRIYGVVPEQFNFAWEKHEDEDGVVREYACADVYLFTALYQEADEILGKSQSMELYPPSINGQWIDFDGQQVFKYTNGSFLGLQVLGDSATPCFQGSAFFSLKENQQIYTLLTTLIEKIDQLSIGGSEPMDNDKMEFVLSDNQKQNEIARTLNAERIQYVVVDSYEDYAIVYNLEDDTFRKVAFSIDENNQIVLPENQEFEKMTCEYLTLDERLELDALRTKDAENIEKMNNMQTEIDDKNNEIATLNIERENLQTTNNELNSQIQEYTAKIEELTEYKIGIETAQKNAMIDKYSEKLPDEVVTSYREKVSEYTLTDLEKELAYELVKNDSTIFSSQSEDQYIPSESTPTGLAALLSKYQK